MPNRIIKESCRTSETLDQISAEAERLFWRLVTVADDHGRFESDPRILLANCFPLKVGELTPKQVDVWFTELQEVDAIRCYYVNKKKYATFVSWESHQRKRAEHSKFPDPVGNLPPPSYDNNCGQMSAEDSECSPMPPPEDNCRQMSAEADIGGEMPPRVVFESSIREARVENISSAFDNAERVLTTRRKRKLAGVMLRCFEEFWETFDHKLGKAEAADAWLDISWPKEKEQRDLLLQTIFSAAKQEALRRPKIEASGKTPKMAQGWISGRRWEDKVLTPSPEICHCGCGKEPWSPEWNELHEGGKKARASPREMYPDDQNDPLAKDPE